MEKFDDRLIAVDEFHHVSANSDNKLGMHINQFIDRNRVLIAMTGSYFRVDAEPVLAPQDEEKFDCVTYTYTYYEQLNGYEYLKQLDIGYFFYSGSYVDDILNVLDPAEKTIIHIPNVNSRESSKDKIREVEHIIGALGEWQGVDPSTRFQLVKTLEGRILRLLSKGRLANVGYSIAGFGLIFVGITFMQQSMGDLGNIISFKHLPADTL